jgi:hypothetical protein
MSTGVSLSLRAKEQSGLQTATGFLGNMPVIFYLDRLLSDEYYTVRFRRLGTLEMPQL